ncbi:Receptor protein-tyrosine kinase [Temnothorax longispinosus]|uniref:Receptor protein-tyrosine kinase n=1 Tax=Temnothorax longispinosus TaxID=300112 RepID=A0A4S2L0M5_9HYME|nr:Receptor protein-tyrosine kinase [Temnothorax longispinosus]
MFNHRHRPRALLTCNFFGVTFLLLIVAGSYDALIQPSSTDVNSTEFVKGKSEFHTYFHLEKAREWEREEVAKAELRSI